MKVEIDKRELATVLAALRYYQSYLSPSKRSSGRIAAIDEIATDGDTVEPLNHADVDLLCERLNTGST